MTDTIVRDSGLPDPVATDAQQHAIAELPNDALMFLMGQPLLRDRPAVRLRLVAVRPDAGRLGARAGDRRFRASAHQSSTTCRRA